MNEFFEEFYDFFSFNDQKEEEKIYKIKVDVLICHVSKFNKDIFLFLLMKKFRQIFLSIFFILKICCLKIE